MPFKPAMVITTQGKTSKANGASLNVKVSQKAGEANIHKVDLTLPKVLPARLTTLQQACTEAQFNTNPAGCPAGSFIGTAKAITPVLSVPLTGPAILVSHGGAAFPDVVFLLQANERGSDIRIDLDGKTDIKKGVTYSRFETVPDAPIASFETNLPEGPHSVLAATGNLCTSKLAIPDRTHGTERREGQSEHEGHRHRMPEDEGPDPRAETRARAEGLPQEAQGHEAPSLRTHSAQEIRARQEGQEGAEGGEGKVMIAARQSSVRAPRRSRAVVKGEPRTRITRFSAHGSSAAAGRSSARSATAA